MRKHIFSLRYFTLLTFWAQENGNYTADTNTLQTPLMRSHLREGIMKKKYKSSLNWNVKHGQRGCMRYNFTASLRKKALKKIHPVNRTPTTAASKLISRAAFAKLTVLNLKDPDWWPNTTTDWKCLWIGARRMCETWNPSDPAATATRSCSSEI